MYIQFPLRGGPPKYDHEFPFAGDVVLLKRSHAKIRMLLGRIDTFAHLVQILIQRLKAANDV